jgi:hypothetical protein
MSLVRLAIFVIFLMLGAAVALTWKTRYARLAEAMFIGWFSAMTLGAGIANRDLWPFSSYPIIPESSERYREAVWYEVVAVDAAGVERRIDSSPLTRTVLQKWVERTFFGTIDDEGRRRAARFLLARANAETCRNDVILGPLAAPDWLLGPASGHVRAQELRIYKNGFSGRVLVYEARE